MKISRIYVTVDGVDYRLLGSELNIELDIRVRELILKALLTSKINHIERDKKMSPPTPINEPENLIVKHKRAEPLDHNAVAREDNARKYQKLLRSHQLNFDKKGKAIVKGSGRAKMHKEVAKYFSCNSNRWVRKSELARELSELGTIPLGFGTIEIYLKDLHKAGFLTEKTEDCNAKYIKVSPSVMHFAESDYAKP